MTTLDQVSEQITHEVMRDRKCVVVTQEDVCELVKFILEVFVKTVSEMPEHQH